MGIDKDRKDTFASRGVAKLASILDSHLRHLSEPLIDIAYVVLALLIILCFTSLAVAEPVAQATDTDKARVTSASSRPEDIKEAMVEPKGDERDLDRGTETSLDDRIKVASSVEPNSQSNNEPLDPYTDPPEENRTRGFTAQLLNAVINIAQKYFYFALIIAAGFFMIYGIRMFITEYKSVTANKQGLLNILEIRHLAPGKAIYLVEVAGKVLMLGVTGNSISPLSEFTDTEQVTALRRAAARRPEPLRPFWAHIGRSTDRSSNEQEKGPKRPIESERSITVEDDSHWREDLRSTGENISRILEEIKKQDKRSPRDSGSTIK